MFVGPYYFLAGYNPYSDSFPALLQEKAELFSRCGMAISYRPRLVESDRFLSDTRLGSNNCFVRNERPETFGDDTPSPVCDSASTYLPGEFYGETAEPGSGRQGEAIYFVESKEIASGVALSSSVASTYSVLETDPPGTRGLYWGDSVGRFLIHSTQTDQCFRIVRRDSVRVVTTQAKTGFGVGSAAISWNGVDSVSSGGELTPNASEKDFPPGVSDANQSVVLCRLGGDRVALLPGLEFYTANATEYPASMSWGVSNVVAYAKWILSATSIEFEVVAVP